MISLVIEAFCKLVNPLCAHVHGEFACKLRSLTVYHSRVERNVAELEEHKLEAGVGAYGRLFVQHFICQRIEIIRRFLPNCAQIRKKLLIGERYITGVIGVIHTVFVKGWLGEICRVKEPFIRRMYGVIGISPGGCAADRGISVIGPEGCFKVYKIYLRLLF